jgi:hypothetical protein
MKERPLIPGELSAEAAAGSAYHIGGLEEAGFKPTLEFRWSGPTDVQNSCVAMIV